jgi:hypothetical protein
VSHAGPLGRMVSRPCLSASSFGYMGGGPDRSLCMGMLRYLNDSTRLTDREKTHRVIGVLKQYM